MKSTKILVVSAIAIALAYVISFFPLYRWPQGGAVTVASMLPIFLVGLRYGLKPGLIAGFVYGILQFIQDPWMLTPIQFLLDYPLAFMSLGLAGLFVNAKRYGALAGIIVGGGMRFICHLLSGAIFFASYAPAGMNPWVYSVLVNGMVQGTDLAICVVVAFVMIKTKAWERIIKSM